MTENTIKSYNSTLDDNDRKICEMLESEITCNLPQAESKIWHGHPVWFLEGNPTVGYSKQKRGIRLMFWSGASFDEPQLNVVDGKFKDASIFYQSFKDVDGTDITRWLEKSQTIAWDYKNIAKRKGVLKRLK